MSEPRIEMFSVKSLLEASDDYVIPIYQRNYAWEAKEIEQLIQDVADYAIYHANDDYYIGTLVVSDEKRAAAKGHATVDGQQRLTTLSLLTAALKNLGIREDFSWFKQLNIRFQSRKKSTATMFAAFTGKFLEDDFEENIRQGYKICEDRLKKVCNERNLSPEAFSRYLYTSVKILRVHLPEGTDLNHYFEIMNSRGEQLEKHEILKAKLMNCFSELEPQKREMYSACFDLVWEACANMEKYVQFGFSTSQRHTIFGYQNYNTLDISDFDDLVAKIGKELSEDTRRIESTLEQVISSKRVIKEDEKDPDSPDRFNSVINFPNFLLHVLKIQVTDGDISLDDKRLLEFFEIAMPAESQRKERMEFAKEFIFKLLRCKFLLDKYIIKREFIGNTDRWSLKSLKWSSSGRVKNGVKYTNTFGDEENESYDSDNRRILMLLSMFHVSVPSLSYKYWLYGALTYLYEHFEVDAKEYIKYLEHLAKAFVFGRYLAKKPAEYESLLTGKASGSRKTEDIAWDRLQFGQIENNLIFNFADYLLWLKLKNVEKDSRVKSFEFTFRSSVEHYYPQVPLTADIKPMPEEHLHSFGNLCLISHEKNSRLSNFPPEAKKAYYGKSATIDSLKQFEMMKESTWFVNQVTNHHADMVGLFRNNLGSDFKQDIANSIAGRWFREYQRRNPVLLCRALLCFGDIMTNPAGDRYYFLDFEYMKEQPLYRKYEEFVEKHEPKSLDEIIEKHLSHKTLRRDWRYPFIKYAEIMKYCQKGNIYWLNDGQFVQLLQSERATEWGAAELYTFIAKMRLDPNGEFNIYNSSESLFIDIKYERPQYQIAPRDGDCSLYLEVWNNKAGQIDYHVVSTTKRSAQAVINLKEFGWEETVEDHFKIPGRAKLMRLENDYADNISNLVTAIRQILGKNFGIELSKA